jgi:hypothetical protein
MGDRSSIYITSEGLPKPIQLYGHWTGSDNLVAVANVLNRTDRIGDPSYLTAQLFYEFAVIQGGYTGSLGFGINSVDVVDYTDDNPPIVVNADTGEVKYEDTHYTQEDFVKAFSEYLNQEVEETNVKN